MTVDVPTGDHAVFTSDGRVFFDLAHLVAEFEPRIKAREFAAGITNIPTDLAYVQAERNMLEAIRQSMDILNIEQSMEG